MSYTFEEIGEEHLTKVLDIYNYYVMNSTATFHTEPLSPEEIREIVFFDDPRYRAFIIKLEEDICGYCILCPFKKREAYNITAEITVYLKHDHTGRGVGSLAAQYIEKLAVKNGIHSLIAIICGENNKSIRMFEKNGYQKCGHFKEVGIKFGRLLDVVYYQKII